MRLLGVPPAVIFAIIVVVVIAAVMTVVSRFSSGQSLAKRFAQLGDMAGRTGMDFVTALGRQPTSISILPHDQRLLHWQDSGQHLAVLFTADHRFVEITHRHRV